MTTFQVAEDAELADALQLVAARLEQRRDFASRYVAELRNAAMPGNGFGGPAAMPWQDRPAIAAAMRAVAAEHPEHAERLEGVAGGLDDSVRHRSLNG